MKRFGVIANVSKPHAARMLEELHRLAVKMGLELVTTEDVGDLLPGARRVSPAELAGQVDVLLAMGGDGTLLRAVRLRGMTDIPVLGVNLGSLGFMTSVTQDRLEPALAALQAGHYTVSRRTLLDCQMWRGTEQLAHHRALNDAVIGWGASSRMVKLGLNIQREPVASFFCDGIIIATPTGSTGHSLSAGGPILMPETSALVVSVICPHVLSHRPLVIPDHKVLTVTVLESPKELLLSVDGQEQRPMQAGDRLVVSKNPVSVQLIELPGHSYFTVLSEKLRWRGSLRE